MKRFTPQRKNANRHTPRGLRMLEDSVQRDGWIGAQTAAADGEMIAGTARLELAAEKFADAEPIVVESDGTRPVVIVRTDIPTADDPRAFGLRLLALNPSVGTATSELALTDGMPPRDLIVSIPPGVPPFGACVLQYTAAPLFSQGNSTEIGPDVHLVTFTLVAQ